MKQAKRRMCLILADTCEWEYVVDQFEEGVSFRYSGHAVQWRTPLEWCASTGCQLNLISLPQPLAQRSENIGIYIIALC